MDWKLSLQEVADKASDLVLVAALFGIQAAIAIGHGPALLS